MGYISVVLVLAVDFLSGYFNQFLPLSFPATYQQGKFIHQFAEVIRELIMGMPEIVQKRERAGRVTVNFLKTCFFFFDTVRFLLVRINF